MAREWFAEPDREKRSVDFAGQLSRDFEQLFEPPCPACPRACDDELVALVVLTHEFVCLAFTHVNWRRVADELLERFKPRHLGCYLFNTSIN